MELLVCMEKVLVTLVVLEYEEEFLRTEYLQMRLYTSLESVFSTIHRARRETGDGLTMD